MHSDLRVAVVRSQSLASGADGMRDSSGIRAPPHWSQGARLGRMSSLRNPLTSVVLACLVVAGPLFAVAHAGTLDDVRARGRLVCGIGDGLRGFSEQDAAGRWQGFDVDFCKAVAAA